MHGKGSRANFFQGRLDLGFLGLGFGFFQVQEAEVGKIKDTRGSGEQFQRIF